MLGFFEPLCKPMQRVSDYRHLGWFERWSMIGFGIFLAFGHTLAVGCS
jgi:hypothetical protein